MSQPDPSDAESIRAFAGDRPFLSRGARRARLLAIHRVPLVIDVGAWRGTYATALRKAGYTGRMLSFEPLSTSFAALSEMAAPDPAWDVHRLALGNASALATLNVAHDSRCNSLLAVEHRSVTAAPESAFTETEEVRVERLDRLWPRLVSAGTRPLLKLDVQGYELEVLRGVGEYLEAVQLLDVELSLVQLYDGGPIWTEVVNYLDARGFRLVSVEPVFEDAATGEMLQVDGIFSR
ncbi:FkbM family methyltransferase [Streptomyces sp. 16-176A]|uniref:FkbM family methyltransferase n=1 Tax=Streptomyces sp. 16-176A TaxID=2530458 RepID=UPI00345CA4E0